MPPTQLTLLAQAIATNTNISNNPPSSLTPTAIIWLSVVSFLVLICLLTICILLCGCSHKQREASHRILDQRNEYRTWHRNPTPSMLVVPGEPFGKLTTMTPPDFATQASPVQSRQRQSVSVTSPTETIGGEDTIIEIARIQNGAAVGQAKVVEVGHMARHAALAKPQRAAAHGGGGNGRYYPGMFKLDEVNAEGKSLRRSMIGRAL